MRNLKRTLSLLLAAFMLIGMMVVGASAAGNVYDNFSDKDEIVNKDAVNLLTILEIMNGTEDGAQFEPTRPVDRAMMAKMIAVILNKGQDNSALYVGGTSKLSDVAGTWAEGYINFCVAQGIIAGRGDGTFDPTATVTASEAAKMLLVAAGYDADIEGYVGGDWAVNANARAASLGIFDGYTGGVATPLTRDDAALLIANALDIEMIQSYTANNYAQQFSDHRTILSAMYGVYKLNGVVVANKWADLEKTGINDALKDGKTRLDDIYVYESNTLNTTTGSAETNANNPLYGTRYGTTTFNVDTPEEYLGERITMYIRKTTVLADSIVLGVFYKEGVNTVLSGTATKETAAKIVENQGLKFSTGSSNINATEYYVNYGYHAADPAAQTKLADYGNGITYKVIDNDDDGYIDYVLYKKEDLAVVSAAKDGNVAMYDYDDGINGVNKNVSNPTDRDTKEKLDLALENGDVVLAITYGSRTYISEPEIVTGQMTAYDSTNLKEQTIDVDGETYKQSHIGKLDQTYTSANGKEDILDLDILDCEEPTGVQFDVNYEFFLDSCGFIRAFRPTEDYLPNYALILESGYNPGVYSSDASGKVTVLLADGTKNTFELNFSASARNLADQMSQGKFTGSAKSDYGVIELKGFLGTDYTDNSTTRPWQWAVDGADNDNATIANQYVFAYKGDSDNTLTEIEQAKLYKAGRAAGYVISYTLNDKDVLTIQNIIGGVGPNAIPNGDWNNYLFGNAGRKALGADNVVHTLRTSGDVLDRNYNTGDATVYGDDANIAVDRNTIAFYYESPTKYDVRTGYQNMASVSKLDDEDNTRAFIASTLVNTSYTTDKDGKKTVTYTNTNLAEAILFDFCPTVVARDYAYVISDNRTTSGDVTLNVIFENGEAGTLKLTRSEFDNNFTSDSCFKTIWAYSIGANGYATMDKGTPVVGNGYRLKVGTVEVTTNHAWTADNDIGYYAYNVDTTNIWDISNARKGQDATKVSDFSKTSKDQWALYLVLNSDGSVRTAFINEEPFGTTKSPAEDHDGHTWSWSDRNNLDSNYKILSGSDTARTINSTLVDNDVLLVASTFAPTDNIYIPADRTLYVDGNLNVDTNNVRVYGPGYLMVNGTLASGASGTVEVENVFVEGTWTLGGSATVKNGMTMYVGHISDTTNTLTVEKGADLHVGYKYNGFNTTGNYTASGAATVNVKGHMEVTGSATNSGGTVVIESKETLIVGGAFTSGNLTVGTTGNPGVLQVGGTFKVSNAIAGVTGSSIVFTEDAKIDAADNSGLKWTANTEVDAETAGTLVGGVTFTFSASADDSFVAATEDIQELPEVTLTVAFTANDSDYATSKDANLATTITFSDVDGDGAENTGTVTLTGANTTATASTTTSGTTSTAEIADASSISLTAEDGTTTVITVSASQAGKQNITYTITVVNGKITPS